MHAYLSGSIFDGDPSVCTSGCCWPIICRSSLAAAALAEAPPLSLFLMTNGMECRNRRGTVLVREWTLTHLSTEDLLLVTLFLVKARCCLLVKDLEEWAECPDANNDKRHKSANARRKVCAEIIFKISQTIEVQSAVSGWMCALTFWNRIWGTIDGWWELHTSLFHRWRTTKIILQWKVNYWPTSNLKTHITIGLVGWWHTSTKLQHTSWLRPGNP